MQITDSLNSILLSDMDIHNDSFIFFNLLFQLILEILKTIIYIVFTFTVSPSMILMLYVY